MLQYVAFFNLKLKVEEPTKTRKSAKPDANGRKDMIFLFKILQKKGFKRILRVIADDRIDPAHRDESVEFALGGSG